MKDAKHGDTTVLLGWDSSRMGNRLVLRLQTATKPPPYEKGDVTSHYVLMSREQAAQLGNYLYQATDQTPPARRRKPFLERLFGG